MKKKIVIIITAVILIVAAVVGVAVWVSMMNVSLDKVVSTRGYEISIPEKWTSDSKGNFYDKNGNLAGSFTLLDVESENPPCLEDVSSVISRDFLSDSVSRYEFSQNGSNVIVYYIKKLPNPEPYAAELVFYDEYVSKRTADKIYATFKAPLLGANPPAKNIDVPERDKMGENAVIITDGEIKDISPLSRFSEEQSAKKSSSIDIFEYVTEDKETVLKSWYTLESDNGKGYLYSYYRTEDNKYTYDNTPVEFDTMEKVISNENNITSYVVKSEEKEVKVAEYTLDRYRDNAKELVEMKTEKTDSEHVHSVMEKILTVEENEKLEVQVEGNTVSVSFNENVKSDKSSAYSQAAVLFGVTEELDSVTVKYQDGKEYKITKDDINGVTKNDVKEVAANEESFIEYTEEVKEEVQAQTQVTGGPDGEIVYSGSVTISYNTMVTHPRTGERVAIGPYAEARGYGAYLGQPISCVIRRSGNGYIATASCGGSVIASYPLNSESQLSWAKGMIGSY